MSPKRKRRVLAIDDEPVMTEWLKVLLEHAGFEVKTAPAGSRGEEIFKTWHPDAVITDLMLPDVDGIELIRRFKQLDPEAGVIIITGQGNIPQSVEAVKAGAFDFLEKPVDAERLLDKLEKAIKQKTLIDENEQLKARLEDRYKFQNVIGKSKKMQELFDLVESVAASEANILLQGENGTGKELVARAIHQHSARAGRPLFAVDCGAIPDTLLDAELFGSVRGAAPGALDRPGLFELADGGTLFLDEIGALPLGVQVKLLRALAQGKSKRVGATEEKLVDVRVIAATNVDLRARIASGAFREDLFYRLNVIPIHLPSLRMRKDDIPLLAYHFLQRYARRAGRDVKRISVEAMRLLRDEEWPGNVRELESAIEHAVVMARGEAILPTDLPFAHERSAAEAHGTASFFAGDLAELPYTDAKERATHAFDVSYLERVMKRTGSNVSEAARQAGMDRSNFRRLLKKARGGKGDADE